MSHWASQIMEPVLKGDALIIGSPPPHPVPSSPYNHQPWWWACVPPVFSLAEPYIDVGDQERAQGWGRHERRLIPTTPVMTPLPSLQGHCPQLSRWPCTPLEEPFTQQISQLCSIISTQFSSAIQLCLTLCDPMDCSTPGLPVHHQLLQLAQTHVQVGDAIQPSHPLSPLLLLPSIFCSISVFSNESALRISWPKYWSFSFNIGPSNEYSGLISFRIDWFDLPAVQGTLKSLLQHPSSKVSILWCSAFSIVQLSQPYTTTGKTIPFTRRTFVGKVISLLFNMLPR